MESNSGQLVVCPSREEMTKEFEERRYLNIAKITGVKAIYGAASREARQTNLLPSIEMTSDCRTLFMSDRSLLENFTCDGSVWT